MQRSARLDSARLGQIRQQVAYGFRVRQRFVRQLNRDLKLAPAAVRLLQQMNHPRAAEFAREAEAYRADFVTGLRDKCGKARTSV